MRNPAVLGGGEGGWEGQQRVREKRKLTASLAFPLEVQQQTE